ncbi:MAG: type II secretion system protein [Akkermansiaceae bacterium]
MKLTKTANTKIKPGMTLIEITVVILVLLTLISVLFIGANIYKKGADRAACILNIRNVHQAVRANQNLKGIDIGDTLDTAAIYGSGLYIEVEPTCPADGGGYTESANYPSIGTAAATCDDYGTAAEDHAPDNTDGW